jgi:two-component system, NarL family, sensor kinase
LQEPPGSRKTRDAGSVASIDEIAMRLEQIRARSDRLVEQLFEGERRFRSLAKAVWMVQEEERRRLARELHDGIGQTLTALVNQLRRPGRPGEAGSDAEDPVHIAELALRDVRELSRLLRPPVLDDLGLKAGLAWLVRTLRERGGLAVSFDWRGPEDRLDPEHETLVFRIAQEALNNAAKHAGRGEARLAVQRHPDRIELEIADDGRGFDVAQALSPEGGAAGLGLRGIRDRVEMFSGRFSIESAPGRGSRLRVVVPLAGGGG